jgi:hypothetical protein
MYNPMRPELTLVLHRERVNAGLRRAARSVERPPDRRRPSQRRFRMRLRMA